MLRRGWQHVDAKLIDKRVVGMAYYRKDGPQFPKHECVVEFTNTEGRVVRLKVEEPLGIVLPDIGGVAPVLASPKGTEAVFDKRDPRINVNAVSKARDQAAKARFDDELR